MYCLDMLAIAIELARDDPAYEDVASKFFEHFVYISQAMNDMGGEGIGLWDEKDGFYYDVLHLPDEQHIPMKVRSMVGLIPLFAVETFEPEDYGRACRLSAAHAVVSRPHPDVRDTCDMSRKTEHGPRLLLTIANRQKLERIYRYMLDENEFFSPHGIRALSKYHATHPYMLNVDGQTHRGGLRAGRIDQRDVRRKLQLARAGMVSDEYPADRVDAAKSIIITAMISRWSARPARANRRRFGKRPREISPGG